MYEPSRNPANWDNFRKAVLVLIIWAAASVLFGIIYFFIWGAAVLRRRTIQGADFGCPVPAVRQEAEENWDAHERTRVCRQSRFRKQRSWSETGAAA